MTRFRLLSDVHLEAAEMDLPVGDDEPNTVLVLAGDVCPVKRPSSYVEFFREMSARFKLVVYVFGNHEYYDDSFLRAGKHFNRQCGDLDNLYVLDGDSIDVDGVKVIGATLWTDFDKHNPLVIEDARWSMNDYNYIRCGDVQMPYRRRLVPSDVYNTFYAHKRFVFDEVYKAKQAGMKSLVVTHHAPTELSVPERFKGDRLNGCYYSDMFNDLYDSGPDVWCHGHIHDKADYMVNKTRVLCNPRGYWKNKDVSHESMIDFDPLFNFEL
jgi:predicted phosphodiesterase